MSAEESDRLFVVLFLSSVRVISTNTLLSAFVDYVLQAVVKI